jgi:AAA domain
MTEARQKVFTTMAELRKTTFPEAKWVVEDLLRTGLRRPSLLVGKPETGKSTMARQLGVAVSQGMPFLGRNTTRGSVIYWQTEEDVRDVLDAFNRLGSKDGDEHIYVLQRDPESSESVDIATQLEADQNINLVIIETLDDLLKINDIKENTSAREAFDKFNTELMIPYGHRAAFLMLHHLKKMETEFAGDALLGASVIRGRTDGKIYMTQISADDERRLIWSTKRKGRAIPKTYLVFDDNTGKSELGETVADEARSAWEAAQQAGQAKLFEILGRHPDIEHSVLLKDLSGMKQAHKLKLIEDNVRNGSIIKSGKGHKGAPFRYQTAALPMETTEEIRVSGPNEQLNGMVSEGAVNAM